MLPAGTTVLAVAPNTAHASATQYTQRPAALSLWGEHMVTHMAAIVDNIPWTWPKTTSPHLTLVIPSTHHTITSGSAAVNTSTLCGKELSSKLLLVCSSY